jgi:hypothetical protein
MSPWDNTVIYLIKSCVRLYLIYFLNFVYAQQDGTNLKKCNLHSCARRSFCVFVLKLLDMNQSVHSLLIIIPSWGSDFCWICQPISFRRVIVISFVLWSSCWGDRSCWQWATDTTTKFLVTQWATDTTATKILVIVTAEKKMKFLTKQIVS